MKTRRSYLAAALLVLTLGACTKRPAQPVFTTLAVDSLLCGEGFSCRIEYRFASIANAQGHPALEAVEESNIAYFFELEAFSGSASEAADTAITQIVKEFVAPVNTAVSDGVFERPGWEGEISVESEGRVVDSLLCYTITRSSYTGGAHGMYSTEHHTYSLADGFELSLADLFDARQIEFLDRAIRGKIAMKYDAADDKALERQKLENAERQVAEVANSLLGNAEAMPVYTAGSMPALKTRLVYPLFRASLRLRNYFRATDQCVSCGLCERICPSKLITIGDDGRPRWKRHGCVQCLACVHRCPTRAIEYGNITVKKGRYRHPDIK